jgi:hypothetical protein
MRSAAGSIGSGTGAALAIGRRHGVVEDGAGMRLEISGPQGCSIVDLLTTDMAGRTVDRGAARPGEQHEASGQPRHRPGAFAQPARFESSGVADLGIETGQEAVEAVERAVIEAQRQRLVGRARRAGDAPQHLERLAVRGRTTLSERTVGRRIGPGKKQARRQAVFAAR